MNRPYKMESVYQPFSAKKDEHRPTDRRNFSVYDGSIIFGKAVCIMYMEFPYTLFYDPQAAVPAEFCLECGCECYAPGLHCLRCERRQL